MSKFYIKYDNAGTWTTVPGAKDIKVNKATDYKDDAQFMLPNYFNEIYSTWEVRIDTGIQVWVDTDVDFLWFQGQITQVITGDPLQIKCLGVMDKLDWYGLPEGSTKFKLDEVQVKSAPVGAPPPTEENKLKVWTEEEESPGWSNTEYRGKFIIISDATLEESNAVMLSEAGSSVVNESGEDNTHVKTQTDNLTSNEGEWEADCWIVERDKPTHNTGNPTKMIIKLDAINDTITTGSDVTKIKIEMKGRVSKGAGWRADNNRSLLMTCGWSIDGVNIDIPLFSATTPAHTLYSASIQEFSFIGDELVIIVEPGTTDQYFNEGAAFWEDGYIILQMEYFGEILGTSRSLTHKIYLNYCKVTTFYNSETFDTVSGKIFALSEIGGEYFDVFATDEDGDLLEFPDRGIAVGDKVTIAESVNVAFQKCLIGAPSSAPPLVIPDNIHKGIANEYFGITGQKLFITLCNYMGYSYWTSYDTVIPFIAANLVSDINNDFITDETVASVAGDVITLTTATTFDVDELNGLEVYVTAGEQIGETFTITDTATNGNITISPTPNANLNGDTVKIQFPERVYDKDNNPPEDLALIEAPNNSYGGVIVYCNAGVTDIIRSGSAPYNDKIKIIVRKDILTIQEAREVGARWALELKSRRLSVNLKWTYLPTEMPHPGKLYTYNGQKWDGSDYTTQESFSDKICRRVSASQDGAAGMWEINGYFGGGSTPGDEALGKAIGNLRVVNLLNQATSMTSPVTGVSRHGQLDGIGTSNHHSKTVGGDLTHDSITLPQGNANEQHLTAAQVAALHATYTNANAVTAMGAKADGNPLHHDFPDGTELNHDALANPNGNAEEQHMTAAQITALHATYTNAQALAIVNATGLALANTKVITSQDADLTFTFGRTQIDSRFSDMMTISHRDMSAQDNYAFGQTSSGSTYINAPTGQLIHLHINDIMKMSLSSGSLSMGIPIAMGANKITGLANAVAANDAMALGQRGAYQLSELSDIDSDLSTVIKSMETTGSGSYPASPKEGQIYYDNDEEMLLRWNNTAGAWIEIGGGAGLVGGNSLYALLTEALLLTGGAVSGAITGSHGHTTLIGQEIQQLSMVGTNGFTESVYWGASQAVPMSDSSADLYMAFSIPIAGTYTLKFLHAKTSATGHDTITYRKYIGEVTPPETISWNIRNDVGDTAIAVTHGIIYISVVETGIVLASNSFLVFRIHKNANEVDGNWHVYGGILERTA